MSEKSRSPDIRNKCAGGGCSTVHSMRSTKSALSVESFPPACGMWSCVSAKHRKQDRKSQDNKENSEK